MLRDLLDNYPALRKNEKKLVWCVWVKLGYINEYSLDFGAFVNAPSESSILREKRRMFVDHPLYKLSEKKYAPVRRSDS